jgi:predicted ATPase
MTDGLIRVQVQGFCSLADVNLEPNRLTVLIGPNGSGKSNLLRALRLAPLLRTGSLQRFVAEAGGASALLHYGPKRTQALTLALEFRQGGKANQYAARLGFAAGDTLLFLDENVGYTPPQGTATTLSSLGTGHKESLLEEAKTTDTTARTVRWWLSQLTYFHFHDTSMTSALRANARTEDHLSPLSLDENRIPSCLRDAFLSVPG